MSITTTYAPAPSVDSTHNPDGFVEKDGTSAFGNIPNHILGRYGTKASNRKDHAIFVRFEIDVPAGATILGAKVSFYATGGYSDSSAMDVSGGFIKPDGSWENEGGIFEWLSWAVIPLAQYFSGSTEVTNNSVFQGNAPAFDAVSTEMVTSLFGEYSFGDGLDAETSVTGLASQLQAYVDERESLRGNTLSGSIPTMFQLYGDFISDLHWQGLIQADNSLVAYRPALTVEYRPAVTTFALAGSGVSIQTLDAIGVSIQSIAGDAISCLSLEGGTMKTDQNITHVRGDDVQVDVTVELDQSRSLDGTETWKWDLKRDVDSPSSLAKTSAGGTITVDGTTKQPTIVIAAADFPANTFTASASDQVYLHELQMTKASKVETVMRGRFVLQSDIVI